MALVNPVLIRMPLVWVGSSMIGFRPTLRRRSDRTGGDMVICLVSVLVFLGKCRGCKG
jgi:hypothetical protein